MKNPMFHFLLLSLSLFLGNCGKETSRPLYSYQDEPLQSLLAPNSSGLLPDLRGIDTNNYADVIRAVYGLDPKYITASDFETVTRKFGRTSIDLRTLPYSSPVLDSGQRPWSAWWYPKFEKTLFDNAPNESTLEKYDRYRNHIYQGAGLRRPTHLATAIERSQFNIGSLTWEGLCNAWSFASLLRPEPNKILRVRLNTGHVSFDIADQKALLMKTYEGILDNQIEVFGQKFTGDDKGWIHPDPFPDQFHRFIEEMLFKRKEAFVMDHDAGIEIWNVPVYKANYQILPIEGRKDAVQVRMWLYSALPLRKEQIQETGLKETIREYHYVLFGQIQGNGHLEVYSGVWIKGPNGTDSRKSHPDYFIRISDKSNVSRESFNSAIESKLVDKLIIGTEL